MAEYFTQRIAWFLDLVHCPVFKKHSISEIEPVSIHRD
jgi:hypothetical protein